MHPGAQEVLASSGLPYLRVVRLQNVADLHALPDDLYVRAERGSSPGRITKAEAINLLRSNGGNDAYNAVPFTWSLAGATCLVQNGRVLVELVLGHLSGLLVQSWVAHRFLFESSSKGPVLDAVRHFQQSRWVDPWSIKQGPTPTANELVRGAPGVEPHSSAHEVARLVLESSLPSSYLTEVMMTADGPLWVDARPYPWAIVMGALFTAPSSDVYRDAARSDDSGLVPLTPRSWTPADVPTDATLYTLILGDRPATCHFVTYALDRGLGVLRT